MREQKQIYLFTTLSLTGGGTERVAAVLSGEVAELGYEVHLLVYRRAKSEYPVSDEVKIHYLDEGWKSGTPIRRLRENVEIISVLLSEICPDYIINLVGDMSLLQMFLASRNYTKKRLAQHKNIPTFIASIRNHPKKAYRGTRMGFLKNQIHLALVRRADACFMQTTEQLDYFGKSVKEKSFVLANPVDEQFFDVVHEEQMDIRKIVTMGRLNRQKNQVLLLEGFSKAIHQKPEKMKEAVLAIYGEGEERGTLEKTIVELELTGRATLCGRTTDPARVLEGADLFILSSDYEGMPNALMEAMAAGMPVIATDCPTGPSDMIQNHENGILIPMKDSQALSDAICFMVDHPQMARDFGRKAKDYATEHFAGGEIAKLLVEQCGKYEKRLNNGQSLKR